MQLADSMLVKARIKLAFHDIRDVGYRLTRTFQVSRPQCHAKLSRNTVSDNSKSKHQLISSIGWGIGGIPPENRWGT